jgi:hypothetical protein
MAKKTADNDTNKTTDCICHWATHISFFWFVSG